MTYVYIKKFTIDGMFCLNTGYLVFPDKQKANEWIEGFTQSLEAYGLSKAYEVGIC